jgi:probable DNA metabolism protein
VQTIFFDGTFSGWQNAARNALTNEIPPTEILWLTNDEARRNLFSANSFQETPRVGAAAAKKIFRVPKIFLDSARTAALIRSGEQWPLLYKILWRLTHGEPKLLEISVDSDVRALQEMEKAIRRDIHKMRAFVRFREVPTENGAWFVAWFEPQHFIVEANAKFFTDRFAAMRWSILTPDSCAHWDMEKLWFTHGVIKAEAPAEDAKENLWLTYYANIFNPARVKVKAMQKEMPKKYWKNLPEAELISPLLKAAPRRVNAMIENSRQKNSTADALSEIFPGDDVVL